jgi:hypothetical protein
MAKEASASQYVFKKNRDLNNSFDTTTVTIESEATTVTEILSDFRDFLLACGFSINGDLVVERLFDYEDFDKRDIPLSSDLPSYQYEDTVDTNEEVEAALGLSTEEIG